MDASLDAKGSESLSCASQDESDDETGTDGVASAEVTLERVTVTECGREHWRFTYQKMSTGR